MSVADACYRAWVALAAALCAGAGWPRPGALLGVHGAAIGQWLSKPFGDAFVKLIRMLDTADRVLHGGQRHRQDG